MGAITLGRIQEAEIVVNPESEESSPSVQLPDPIPGKHRPGTVIDFQQAGGRNNPVAFRASALGTAHQAEILDDMGAGVNTRLQGHQPGTVQ